MKVDKFGSIFWQTAIGGGSGDFFHAIITTSDGGYAILGSITGAGGDIPSWQGGFDYLLVKLDGSGNISWVQTYGSPTAEEGFDIKQTADGGYFLVGYASGAGGDVSNGQGDKDYWALKTDAAGVLVWEQALGSSSDDVTYGFDLANDGGYYLAGYTNGSGGDVTSNTGNFDFCIVKLDASGNLVWENSYGGGSTDWPQDVVITNDGNLVIVGQTRSTNGDVSSNIGNRDFWVIKLSDGGSLLWEDTIGGTVGDYATSVVELASGKLAITGYGESSDGDFTTNSGGFDGAILVIGDDGNL